MEPALTERQARLIIRLLGAITVLVMLLVLGLAGAGGWTLYVTQRATGKVQAAQAAAKARETSQQISDRQDEVAEQFSDIARNTRRQMEDLKKRRATLEDTRGGPGRKLDLTLRLGQLMSDQFFVLTDNLTRTEAALGRGVRPLDAERELTNTPPPSAAAAKQSSQEAKARRARGR